MKTLTVALAAAAALTAQTVDEQLTAIAQRQFAARRSAIARIRTAGDVRARQDYIHARLLEEIGGLPARTSLNARVTGTMERAGYRVEKLIYESQPRFYVTANLYIPTTGPGPFPAVLGTAGHSVAGKAEDLYQRVWISLARRGFVVLAYDPPGQGERLEYLDAATGKSRAGVGTGEHSTVGPQCLLTGTNLARFFIWDGIRGVDYLLTRREVDGKRIAVAGNSGGGTQSSYLAAFEPRLAAAAPSCYLTTWEKLWAPLGPQDSEQVFANFLRDGLDFADFLIAFAPKPIHMAAAVRDYFPIEGARATYAEARSLFGILGAADRAGFFEFDDTHGWSKPRREATYRWLARWLQERPDDGVEPADLTVEAPDTLAVTRTGQVATSFTGAATVQSLNAALAGELAAKRPSGRDLPSLVAKALALTVPPRRPGGRGSKAAVICAGRTACEGEVVLPLPAPQYPKPYQTAMRAILVGKTLIGMRTEELLRAFAELASRPGIDPRRITIESAGNDDIAAIFAAVLEPRIARIKCERLDRSYLEMARETMPHGLAEIAIPGVLRDFDLPELVQSLGPRATR